MFILQLVPGKLLVCQPVLQNSPVDRFSVHDEERA